MHFNDSIANRRKNAKQRSFLRNFALSGNVLASAKQAGISRALVYWWQKNSPAFAEELSAAAGEAFGESRTVSPQCERKSARRGTGSKQERTMP